MSNTRSLVKLNEIHLALEDDPNPIFQDKAEYVKGLAKQPFADQLKVTFVINEVKT